MDNTEILKQWDSQPTETISVDKIPSQLILGHYQKMLHDDIFPLLDDEYSHVTITTTLRNYQKFITCYGGVYSNIAIWYHIQHLLELDFQTLCNKIKKLPNNLTTSSNLCVSDADKYTQKLLDDKNELFYIDQTTGLTFLDSIKYNSYKNELDCLWFKSDEDSIFYQLNFLVSPFHESDANDTQCDDDFLDTIFNELGI